MRPNVTTCRAQMPRRAAIGLCLATIFITLGAAPAMAGADTPARDVGTLSPAAAHQAALTGEVILIDIRRPDEWLTTRVGEGAVGLDMRAEDFVSTLVALRRANPETPIALICRTGNRSNYVVTALAAQGFPGLIDVNEGMVGGSNGPGWLKHGLPTYEGSSDSIAAKRSALPL